MKHTLNVGIDDKDRAFITFPESLLLQLKWKTGDEIKWKANEDGSFLLSKVVKRSKSKRNKV